jgi:hypothetical protein
MNLIDMLRRVADRGYKSASMDVGLGLQTWPIEEMISDFTAQLSRLPDEDCVAECDLTSDYILDEWILDAENEFIERLDYSGNKTGDIYNLK